MAQEVALLELAINYQNPRLGRLRVQSPPFHRNLRSQLRDLTRLLSSINQQLDPLSLRLLPGLLFPCLHLASVSPAALAQALALDFLLGRESASLGHLRPVIRLLQLSRTSRQQPIGMVGVTIGTREWASIITGTITVQPLDHSLSVKHFTTSTGVPASITTISNSMHQRGSM